MLRVEHQLAALYNLSFMFPNLMTEQANNFRNFITKRVIVHIGLHIVLPPTKEVYHG